MSETELTKLIWVPASWATEFEAAASEAAQRKVIDDILEKTKTSMRGDLEQLEEDALRFRGLLLGYKEAYSKVLQEHFEASYKVWEDLDSMMPSMKASADKLLREFSEVKPAVEEVSRLVKEVQEKMDSLSSYSLTRMIELVRAVEGCDGRTKDVLRRVLTPSG